MTFNLAAKVQQTKPSVVKIQYEHPNPESKGSGSGFLINDKGIVITNSHVVPTDEPEFISVRFYDGEEKQCKEILHRDEVLDIIILKIEEGKYPFLKLGNYDDVNEGDDVYFCGYPFAFNHHTSHKGMVSAKVTEDNVRGMLIDGSINSGNSGGPLLSMDDQVVGIITNKSQWLDNELKKLIEEKPIPGVNVSVKFNVVTDQFGNEISGTDPISVAKKTVKFLRNFTNVGMGFAISIEYAKSELSKRDLIT